MKTQKNLKTTKFIIGTVFALSLIVTSCSSDDDGTPEPEPTNTIYDLVDNDFAYSEFAEAVNLTEFESELSDMSSEFTVLIPTNNAFIEFYAENVFESNEEKIEALKMVLRRHIINTETILYDDANEGIEAQNMNGDDMYFYLEGEFMLINIFEAFATVAIETDIAADNGIIHLVGNIILEH